MSSSSSLQQHDRSRKDQGNAPNYEAFENYNSDVRDNTSNPQHHTTKNGREGEGQNSGPLHCSSSSSSSRVSSSHRSRRSKSHSVSHEGSYSSSSARSSPRSFRRSFSSSSSSLSQDGSEIVKDATSRAEQLRNENNTKKESTLRALLPSQTATTAKARTASASSPSRYPAQPSEKINDFTPFTSSEEIELILDSKFPYPAPNRIQQSKLDYYLNSVRGPRFSSAVEAKAFLYSTHRLLQTEDTLRESIEKGCEELLSDWLPHKATLLLLHERDQREILQLLLRERKYRAFVEEEAAEDWEAEITTPLLEAHLFYEKGGLTLASLPILAAFEEDEGNERRCLEYVEDKESGQLFELMIDELVDIEQREELANDNLDSEKNRQSREEGDNNYKSSQKYNNLARNHESTVSSVSKSRSAAGKTSSDRGTGEENAGGGLFSIGADGEVVFVGDNGPVPVSSSHQSHKVNASPVKKHDDDDRTAMLLMVATTVVRRRNADSPLPARSTSLATEGSCSLSQASCLDGRTAAFRQKDGGGASVSVRSGIGPSRSSHHVGAPYNSIAPLSMSDLNELRASRNGTPNAAARNPLNPYNYGFDRSSGTITPLGRAGVPLRARSGGSSSPRSPCLQQEGDEGQNKEEKEPRSWWSRASSTSNFSSSRYGSPACSNTNGGDGGAQHHHNYDRWSENSLQLFTHSHHKSDRTFAADYVAHQLVANRIKVRELGDARRADAAEANRVAAQRTKEENLLLRQALERANIKALRRSFAHVVKRRDEHKSQRKTFEATRAAYHAKLRKGHSTKYLAYKWDLHMSKYGPLEAAKLEVLLKSPPRSPSPTAGRGDGKSATDEETNRLPVLSVGGSDSKEHQQEMARRRRRPSYASPTARSLSIAVVNTSKQHEHEAGHRSQNGSRPNSPPPLLSSSVSTRDALLPPPPLADLRPNTPSHARAVAGLAPLPAFKMPPKVVFGQRPASSPFYSSTHTTSPLGKRQPNKIKQQVAGDLSGGGASSFSNGSRRLAPIGRTAPYRPASSASQLNHPSAGAVAGNSHSLSTFSSYPTLGAPVAVSSGGNGSRRPKTAVDHTTFSASSASNPQARRGGPNGGYCFTNVLRNAPLSLSSSSISNAPTAVATIAAKRTPSSNKPTHNEADNSIATTKKSRGGQRKGVLPVIIHPTETKLVRTAQCYATMLSSGGVGKESRANVDGKGEKKPQEQPRIQLDVTSVSSNARAPIAFVLTTKQKQSSGAQNAGAGAGVSSCETATVASVFAASLFTHLQSLEHEEVTDIGTLYERAAWCFSKSKSLVATAQQQRAMEGGKHEDESHHHQPQQLLRQADALLMEGERILRRLEEAHDDDDDDDDSMIPHCVPNKPSVSLTLGEGEEEGTVDDNNLHQNNENNIFVFDHHATVHCLKVLRGGASASVLRATRQLSLALKALEEVAALESKGVMPMKMTSSPQKPIRMQQQQQQQRSEPSDHHHRPHDDTCAVALDLENDTKDTEASNREKNKKEKSNKSGGASRDALSKVNEMKEGNEEEEEDRKTPKKKGMRDREKTNSPRSADRSPSAYSDDFVSDLEENKKEDYSKKNDVGGSKHDDREEGNDTYTPYASSAPSSSSPTSSRASSYSPSSSRTSSPPPTHLARRSEDETTVTQRHEAAKTANTMIKMEGTGTIYSGKGNKSPRRSPDRYQQQQQQNQRVNPHNGMPEFILVDYSRGVKGGTFSKASKPVSGRHGLDDPSSNTNKSISAKSNAAHRTRSNPNNNSGNREEGEEHDDENTAHNAKRTATNPVTLANLAAICTALGRAEEAIAYGRKASEAVTDQLEANVEAVVAALRKADDTTQQRTNGKSNVKADGIDSDAGTRPQLEGLTEKAREDTTRSQDDGGGHKGNDSAAAIVVRVPIPFPDALEMSVTVLTTIAAAQLSQGRSTRSAAVPKVGPRPLGSMPSERASAPRTYRLALGLAEEVLGGGHPITSYCQRCVDGLLGEDGK